MAINAFSDFTGLVLNGELFTSTKIQSLNKDNPTSYKEEILSFASSLFSKDEKIELQTSGSTGTPKKITFPKTALIKSAVATNSFFALGSDARALLALPMQYIAAKMMVARAIVGGYNLVLAEPSAMPLAQNQTFDFAPLTPHQFATIVRQKPDRLKNVQQFLLGGGAPNTWTVKEVRKRKLKVFSGFGMTETLTHFALADLSSAERGIEYRLLDDVEIKIDKLGHLHVNRPGITSGFLQTNDLVKKTSHGFIWLGRADNLINSGGVKIIPERVEEILSHKLKSPFFVGALNDENLGQKAVLFVEGDEKPVLTDVKWDFPFQQPREIINLSSFCRTASGKIQRSATIKTFTGES